MQTKSGKTGANRKKKEKSIDKTQTCGYNTQAHSRECWNGRQARLRCVWLCRVGSSPISRTKKREYPSGVLSFFGYKNGTRTIRCRCPVDICWIPAGRNPHRNEASPISRTKKESTPLGYSLLRVEKPCHPDQAQRVEGSSHTQICRQKPLVACLQVRNAKIPRLRSG